MNRNMKLFLKGNKVKKANTFYPATESLKDENGNGLEWEIRPVSTREADDIRDECMEIREDLKNGAKMEFNSRKYIRKMICAAVVYPDLYDKDLQDSYGVKTPEDLIVEMIDNPNEYNALSKFVQNFNGEEKMQDLVDEAKN